MKRKFWYPILTIFFLLYPSLNGYAQQEPPLYQIYNTIYGTDLDSDQELEDIYGLDDCSDDIWLGASGYVVATARYASYTQLFGYYTDTCGGNNRTELFNVTRDGYLSLCSQGSQNRGDVCVDDGDCIRGYCREYYSSYFLVGEEPTLVGFYDDPSGSPPWFTQPSLNGSNTNDHMKTYRAADFNPLVPEYLIAWEDSDLGDGDYNDLVLVLQNVAPSCLDIECCAVNADCNDANNCTVDTCVGGYCQHTSLVCNDSNVCTNDSCNPVTGCVYTNNTASCSDGNACTTSDTCSGGACVGGAALNCNDSNVCTNDSCNTSSGCVHTNNSASCSDGNACTTSDTCSGGACVGGAALNCNDSNVCTNDSCNTSSGCVHTNNTASCSDGNACTTSDICSGGACVGGAALNCNDSNVCTNDSCNTSSGCVHTNNSASCSDGNACTTSDTCSWRGMRWRGGAEL